MLLFLILLTALFLLAGCTKKDKGAAAADAQKPINAGFVYVGHIGDAGWTFSHDQGRKEMETLPYVDPSVYIEGVPEGADAVRVITSLADKGHNPIFANSFGYMDAMVEVAKKYPNIIFMHCSGYKTAPNLGTYFGRIEEARYLSGIVAGKMTKSNIIGYVAAYPIPEVIRGINSFTLGAQSVNPGVTVRVVWTQTWYDPALERSAADSLLDVGADILTMHQDTPAAIQAAKDKNKLAIGYHSDMSKYAPETFLTAPVWNWGGYYKYVAERVHDGTWQSSQDMWGMKEGLVDLAPFGPKVPEDVKAIVAEKKQMIIDGKLMPFQGPIIDQDGKIRIPADRSATQDEELTMDYFVKGVVGKPQ